MGISSVYDVSDQRDIYTIFTMDIWPFWFILHYKFRWNGPISIVIYTTLRPHVACHIYYGYRTVSFNLYYELPFRLFPFRAISIVIYTNRHTMHSHIFLVATAYTVLFDFHSIYNTVITIWNLSWSEIGPWGSYMQRMPNAKQPPLITPTISWVDTTPLHVVASQFPYD